MDNSAIMCDKVIESQAEDVEDVKMWKSYDETKAVPTNFHEQNKTCKKQSFYILLAFLLISIALLIAVSIYCYLIKYQAKQKHLLREVLY